LAFTPNQNPFFFARLKKLKIQKLGPTVCALCQVFKKSKIKEPIQIRAVLYIYLIFIRLSEKEAQRDKDRFDIKPIISEASFLGSE
jgi:hypothetical protein